MKSTEHLKLLGEKCSVKKQDTLELKLIVLLWYKKNACCHSVKNLLSSSLLSKNTKINTFTAIVDLSRSNFSIARTPLFQLKSAM